MDGWDYALLAGAGFIAVSSLVGLMLKQRDQLLDQLKEHLTAARKKRREKRETDGA